MISFRAFKAITINMQRNTMKYDFIIDMNMNMIIHKSLRLKF